MPRSLRHTIACAVLLAVAPLSTAHAQTAGWAQHAAPLQRALDSLVTGFRGTVGVYVRHLRTGQAAAINADTLFPTASMVKVPILIGTFDAIERGELDFHHTPGHSWQCNKHECIVCRIC